MLDFEDQLLMKKPKKAHGDFYVGKKGRIWLKLTFSSLLKNSSKIPDLFQRCIFEIFNRKFQNFKNIACSIMQSFTI